MTPKKNSSSRFLTSTTITLFYFLVFSVLAFAWFEIICAWSSCKR